MEKKGPQRYEAWKHHTGPFNKNYITDATKRSKTRVSKRSTIFKKAHELIQCTGGKIVVLLTQENGDEYAYASEESDWDKLNSPQGVTFGGGKKAFRIGFDDENTERVVASISRISGKTTVIKHVIESTTVATPNPVQSIATPIQSISTDTVEQIDDSINISLFPQYPTPSKSSSADFNFIKSLTPITRALDLSGSPLDKSSSPIANSTIAMDSLDLVSLKPGVTRRVPSKGRKRSLVADFGKEIDSRRVKGSLKMKIKLQKGGAKVIPAAAGAPPVDDDTNQDIPEDILHQALTFSELINLEPQDEPMSMSYQDENPKQLSTRVNQTGENPQEMSITVSQTGENPQEISPIVTQTGENPQELSNTATPIGETQNEFFTPVTHTGETPQEQPFLLTHTNENTSMNCDVCSQEICNSNFSKCVLECGRSCHRTCLNIESGYFMCQTCILSGADSNLLYQNTLPDLMFDGN